MSTIAVHHVELCKNPVVVQKEDKQVFFDESNKELVTVTPKGICCSPVEGEARGTRSYYRYYILLLLAFFIVIFSPLFHHQPSSCFFASRSN